MSIDGRPAPQWRFALILLVGLSATAGSSRRLDTIVAWDFMAAFCLAAAWFVLGLARSRSAQRRMPLLAVAAVGGSLAGALAGNLAPVVLALVGWIGVELWLLESRKRKTFTERIRLEDELERRENHQLELAQSLGGLLASTPTEFEHTMEMVLNRLGFAVQRVGGPGDKGADLLGRDRFGRSVVVQCKRHVPGNKVSSPAVQAFIGMQLVQHRTDRGVFITTSSFTRQARELADAHNVALIDGEQLVQIVRRLSSPNARHALGLAADETLPLI